MPQLGCNGNQDVQIDFLDLVGAALFCADQGASGNDERCDRLTGVGNPAVPPARLTP
jgi:hypothetical protein